MNILIERAKELRAATAVHYNCAQSVALPFAEAFGIPEDIAMKFAAGFGGGMKRGGICGAVTGGVMALGFFGIDDPKNLGRFYRRIQENHEGYLECRDLLRINAEKGFEKKPHCDAMVYEAIGLAEEVVREVREEKLAAILREFVGSSAEILGKNLTGVYLHGSGAMGCWNPERSDIDLILTVREAPSDEEKKAFLRMLLALREKLPGDPGHDGFELSIVTEEACRKFEHPTPFVLHFSAGHLKRVQDDIDRYIAEMKGLDPDLAAHFTVILTRGKCLYGKEIAEMFAEVPEDAYLDSIFADISEAEEDILENPVYVILNLCRVLGFIREKKVLSKREGGEWALENIPEDLRAPVRTALLSYIGGRPFEISEETFAALSDFAARMIAMINTEK
ncbi:MAG: DUF4111 domain-containing protein [Lachnospiraceae bacterium]|nr:DUF4111 domain-containing protein [Lachnospiraceae bacterium]